MNGAEEARNDASNGGADGHDVLVWGPASEGERTASGRTVAKGWVWTCSCGAWDDGYPSEDTADYGAGGNHAACPNKRADAERAARLEAYGEDWDRLNDKAKKNRLASGVVALRQENERLRLSLAWVRDHADGIQEIIDSSNFETPRNMRVAVKDLRTVVRIDLGEEPKP